MKPVGQKAQMKSSAGAVDLLISKTLYTILNHAEPL